MKQLLLFLFKKTKSNILFYKVANSLWVKKGIDIKDSFKETATKFYNAKAEQITTVEKINSWVSKATDGHIKTIFDDIGKDDVMILINGFYNLFL